MKDETSTFVISDADEDYLLRLRAAIDSVGGKLLKYEWGMAGSVEVTFASFEIGDATVEIDVDNYGNGRIKGPSIAIAEISRHLDANSIE